MLLQTPRTGFKSWMCDFHPCAGDSLYGLLLGVKSFPRFRDPLRSWSVLKTAWFSGLFNKLREGWLRAENGWLLLVQSSKMARLGGGGGTGRSKELKSGWLMAKSARMGIEACKDLRNGRLRAWNGWLAGWISKELRDGWLMPKSWEWVCG